MHPSFSPNGRVFATCWAVIDCGVQDWWHEDRCHHARELRLGFEIIGGTGWRRVLQRRYRFNLRRGTTLRRDLESWLGRDLPAPFDFGCLLGQGARLGLTQQGDGYRRIDTIEPLAGPVWPPQREPLLILLDERFDPAAFARAPEPIRDRILRSPTFLALHGEHSAPAEFVAPALDMDRVPW